MNPLLMHVDWSTQEADAAIKVLKSELLQV